MLNQKTQKASRKHSNEFVVGSNSILCFKLCNITVNCHNEFNFESHIKTTKHASVLIGLPNQTRFVADNKRNGKSFSRKVAEAFLFAEIPPKNFRIQNWDFFWSMNALNTNIEFYFFYLKFIILNMRFIIPFWTLLFSIWSLLFHFELYFK